MLLNDSDSSLHTLMDDAALADFYSNALQGELSVEQIKEGLTHKAAAVRAATVSRSDCTPSEDEIKAILDMEDPNECVLRALLERPEKLLTQDQIKAATQAKYQDTFLMAVERVTEQNDYRLTDMKPEAVLKRLNELTWYSNDVLGEGGLIKKVQDRLTHEQAEDIATGRNKVLGIPPQRRPAKWTESI